MGDAFREVPDGLPEGDYFSREIVDGSGAPSADSAFTGLTSYRRVTIAETLARLETATRCTRGRGTGSSDLRE